MTKAALALIVLIIIITLLVRMVESRFAFFPLAGETVTPGQFGVQHEALSIETEDGEKLRVWAMGHPAPRAHTRTGRLSTDSSQGYRLVAALSG